MRLAKTYAGYKFDESKAYDKNGKLYVKATCVCDRCVKGVFVCRVENGMPVPHPNANGVCFKCGGSGTITKEVRLYTDEEYKKMENANIKAAEKRASEREAKMKAEYDEKKAKWIEENGFNAEGLTYVYFPNNSYNVKETLKDEGFRFSSTLMWHCSYIPVGYEDKVIEIKMTDLVEFSAWGEGHYIIGAKEEVDAAMRDARRTGGCPSEWIGDPKDKIYGLSVTLTDIHNYNSKYGVSSIVRFETESGNIVKWFTSTNIDLEIGSKVLVSATIKENIIDKYEDDMKVTIITRAKLKAV